MEDIGKKKDKCENASSIEPILASFQPLILAYPDWERQFEQMGS